MSSVYLISDTHLGHRNILKHIEPYREQGAYRGGTTVDEHDEWVIECLKSVSPNKRTTWWFLGDVAMDISKLELLRAIPGKKNLIMGNHDLFQTRVYTKYFDSIYGTIKKYGVWLSHVPVHPLELRGLKNVHGHSHKNDITDDRYLNVCIEWRKGVPLSLDELRTTFL